LGPDGTTAKQSWQQAIASRIVQADAPVLQLLDRLVQNDTAKILAEPTLVTLAGRPASFHSGGEFPVPIPQDDGAVATEYRQFGTHVDLVPLDLGDGQLRLEIRARVSELDSANSRNVGGRHVPALRTRMVNTAAELKAGQTLIIGGLVQNRQSGDRANTRSQGKKSEEVELLLLATPSFVDGSEFGVTR
jgi:pilus assembly protein CpaC